MGGGGGGILFINARGSWREGEIPRESVVVKNKISCSKASFCCYLSQIWGNFSPNSNTAREVSPKY